MYDYSLWSLALSGQGPLDDVTRSNIAAAEELLKELKPKAR